MKRLLFILPLLAIILGCSPQLRLNRLLNKNPHLAVKDTLIHRDTIYTFSNSVSIDTIHSIESLRKDTLVINKENLTIKTFIHKDSIFIYGLCDTIRDTIIYEKLIPYDKFYYDKETRFDRFVKWAKKRFILFVVLVIVLAICLCVIGYYIKPVLSFVNRIFKGLGRLFRFKR